MPQRILKAAFEHGPDMAAAVSGTAAGISWLATANDVLQMGATAVAIVAGIYAVKWHRLRIKDMKAKLDRPRKDVKEVKAHVEDTRR